MGFCVTGVFSALQAFLLKLEDAGLVSHASVSLVIPSEKGHQGKDALAACLRDLLHSLEFQLMNLQEESSKTYAGDPDTPALGICSSMQDVLQGVPSCSVVGSITSSTSLETPAALSNPCARNGKEFHPRLRSLLEGFEGKDSYRKEEKQHSVSTRCESCSKQEAIVSPVTSCKKFTSKTCQSIPSSTSLEINLCTCLISSIDVPSTTTSANSVSSDTSIVSAFESSHSQPSHSLKAPKPSISQSIDCCLLRKKSSCLKYSQSHCARLVRSSRTGCNTVSTFTSPGLAEALLGLSSSSTANSVFPKGLKVACLETAVKSGAVKGPELFVTVSPNLSSDVGRKTVESSCSVKCCDTSIFQVVPSPVSSHSQITSISDNKCAETPTDCSLTSQSNAPVATHPQSQRWCGPSNSSSASRLASIVTSTPSTGVCITSAVTPAFESVRLQSIDPGPRSSVQFLAPSVSSSSSLLMPVQGPPVTTTLSSPPSSPSLRPRNADSNYSVQFNSSSAVPSMACVSASYSSDSNQTHIISTNEASCSEHEHVKTQSTFKEFLTPPSMVAATHELLKRGSPVPVAPAFQGSRVFTLTSSGESTVTCASPHGTKLRQALDMKTTCHNFHRTAEDAAKLECNSLGILAMSKLQTVQLQATNNTLIVPTHSETSPVTDANPHGSNRPLGTSTNQPLQNDMSSNVMSPDSPRTAVLENNVIKEISSIVALPIVQCHQEPIPLQPYKLTLPMDQTVEVSLCGLAASSSEIPSDYLAVGCSPPPHTIAQMITCSNLIRTINAPKSIVSMPSTTQRNRNLFSDAYACNRSAVVQTSYHDITNSVSMPALDSGLKPDQEPQKPVLHNPMGPQTGPYLTTTLVTPPNSCLPITLSTIAERDLPPAHAASPPSNSHQETQEMPWSELPVYCCKVCSVACPTIDMFVDHTCRVAEDLEVKEGADEEPPPDCPRTLITSEEELRQMRRFTCAVCGVEFRALRRIACHLTRCRSGPYPCPACGALYTTRTALHQHMKTQHRREKCHLCPECGKSFERRTSLEKHLIKWHEDASARGPFRCDACPKKFIRRIYLTNHKLRMHKLDKKYLCQCCGRRFLGAASLSVHEREAHGPTPRPFACTQCDKTFAKKEKLVFHLRWHSGERPFVCTVCGLGFVSTSKLNEHITRRHQPAHSRRRYHCPHCDKSYANCSDLKKHARRAHDSELTSAQCIPSITPVNAQLQLDAAGQSDSDRCRADGIGSVTERSVPDASQSSTKNKKTRNRTSSAKPALGRKRKRGSCNDATACGPTEAPGGQMLSEAVPRLSTTNLPETVQEITFLSEQSQPGSITDVTSTTLTSPPPQVQHHQLLHHYQQQQQQIQVSSNILIPHIGEQQQQQQSQQQVFCSMQSMLPQTLPALFHVLQHNSQHHHQQLQSLSMPPSFNTYIGAGHQSSVTPVDHLGLHPVPSAVNVAASATSILDGNTTVLYSNASVVLPSSMAVSPSLFHHTVGALTNNSHINGTVVMPGQTSILLSSSGNCNGNNTSASTGLSNSLSLLPGTPNVLLVPTPAAEYTSTSQQHHHPIRQTRIYELNQSIDENSGLPSVLSSSFVPGSLPPG